MIKQKLHCQKQDRALTRTVNGDEFVDILRIKGSHSHSFVDVVSTDEDLMLQSRIRITGEKDLVHRHVERRNHFLLRKDEDEVSYLRMK